jgi:hypothetical protein
MAKRPKLRLVGSANPADVFDDLAALRQEQHNPSPQRRQRSTETFARIPHDRGLALYRQLGGPAWVLLIELDRLILKGRGRNPIKLTSGRLRDIGIGHNTRRRALQELEAAGVIRIERRGRGRSPWVLHLWYPRQD